MGGCCDDRDESSLVQEGRIQERSEREELSGGVGRANGGQGTRGPRERTMKKNKANVQEDCLVSEILQELPMCLDLDWPDGQTVRPRTESRTGLG